MSLGDSLQLAGLGLDLIGAFLLANGLLSGRPVVLPRILFSALYRGRVARGKVRVALSQEDHLKSLQGVAFIAAGFLVQAVGLLLAGRGR